MGFKINDYNFLHNALLFLIFQFPNLKLVTFYFTLFYFILFY